MTKSFLTLGIETSCDETALALYDDAKGIVGEVIKSQVAMHSGFGGVVPELAARDHFTALGYLLEQLLDKSGYSLKHIDAIGCTQGPGLIGALRVGTRFAEGLATGLNIPLVGVHHMEAHLLVSELVTGEPISEPQMALLVSGGHTLLVHVKERGCYQLLGQTLDDAVGEAFDKAARLLGLGYPGGPAIEKAAKGYEPHYHLPSPMLHKGLNFSFSGLKTALLYKVRDLITLADTQANFDSTAYDQSSQLSNKQRGELAASFQKAAVKVLVAKCKTALQQHPCQILTAGGGVACNVVLRQELTELCKSLQVSLQLPPLNLCTDNGAMIAYAARQRLTSHTQASHTQASHTQVIANTPLKVRPRFPLDELTALHRVG